MDIALLTCGTDHRVGKDLLWKKIGSDISGATYQQNVTNWKFQTCVTYGPNPLGDV